MGFSLWAQEHEKGINFIELYFSTWGNLDGVKIFANMRLYKLFYYWVLCIIYSWLTYQQKMLKAHLFPQHLFQETVCPKISHFFFSIYKHYMGCWIHRWQLRAMRKRLFSILPFDLFQLMFMVDWTLPALPKRQATAVTVPNVLHVGPAVSLHSRHHIIRVNSAVPDEGFTQHYVFHVQWNINTNV